VTLEALPDGWLLGGLRLWVCFACLPWLRGLWWGWAAGVALAALAVGGAPEGVSADAVTLSAAAASREALTGLVLGLSARALCLAGRALTGLLEGGLPGRGPLRVSGELWFGALLILQGGHVALMEAAALSLRWLPVGAPMTSERASAVLITSVGAAWALAAGLALPLLFAAAALEVSLGIAHRVSLISVGQGQGAQGLRGELLRWLMLWALVLLCAQTVGPWWVEALTRLRAP
jgi:hypothetical protein